MKNLYLEFSHVRPQRAKMKKYYVLITTKMENIGGDR
jgi:hypothetical protein